MKEKIRSIRFNIVLTLIIALTVFFVMLFMGFNGNVTGFYRIGKTNNTSPYLNKKDLKVFEGGCDGQQFLTLALDPLMLNPKTQEALDNPYYRGKRIMYPLLGYVFGAGNPRWIIYSLSIINFLCLGFLVFISSLWLRQNLKSTNWALGILIIPSVWMILSLSTSEMLCASFSLAALYYFKKNNVFFTVFFLTMAIFTKETAFLVFVVLVFSAAVKKNFRFMAYLSISAILFILWNLYLSAILQTREPSFLVSWHFSFPFHGIVQKVSSLIHTDNKGLVFFYETGAFFLLLFSVVVGLITAIKNFRAYPELSLLFLLQVVLLIMFNTSILDKFGNYTRVCMEIYLYSFIMLPWSDKISKKLIPVASSLISVGYIIGFFIQ